MSAPSISTPQAGLYRVRLCKGGPWVPLRIWYGPSFDPATREPCDRSHHWRAELNGEQVDVWDHWPYCAGQPIPESEYRYMLATFSHAAAYEPAAPQANPRRRIDLLTTPMPF